MVELRTRVAALVRAFLGLLEGAEPSLAGLAVRVQVWLTENQRTLGAPTRQALDRQVLRYDGDAVAAADQLSRAALVQANAMVLALGLAATGEVVAAARARVARRDPGLRAPPRGGGVWAQNRGGRRCRERRASVPR